MADTSTTSSTGLNHNRLSLLSSQSRVQVPWVKITIGTYTFGVFMKTTRDNLKTNQGFFTTYNVQYPNYVQSLQIQKINGQVNTYSLTLAYPVTADDDPNFFEKVLSSVSSTRKIVFSYGDASMPSYIYKDEEAIITNVTENFNFGNGGTINSVIGYNIQAVSAAALENSGCYTFVNSGHLKKPSDEIKRILSTDKYGLKKLFSGMNDSNISKLIAGDDKRVMLDTKVNVSAIDYINYLVSCMIPAGSAQKTINDDIYILTIHDDTTYDQVYVNKELVDGKPVTGPYFKVTRTGYTTEKSDAYVVDIGINTSTIVTNFTIKNNESYSLYFDYQQSLNDSAYVRRLNKNGEWEEVYAPNATTNNDSHITKASDTVWWTKLTKYPISAELTIQGLLRPATLMSYVRLNVVFPGGKQHISSGLYIVTKQIDSISESGYRTTLSLTRLET